MQENESIVHSDGFNCLSKDEFEDIDFNFEENEKMSDHVEIKTNLKSCELDSRTKILELLKVNNETDIVNVNNKDLDEEFLKVNLHELTSERIDEAINSSCFMSHLKPFLIDLLKRKARFEFVINLINDFLVIRNENMEWLEELTQRDLICALIEHTRNKAKLGNFLLENNYPIPIMYDTFNPDTKTVEKNLSLNSLDEILNFNERALFVNIGTKSAKNIGKTSIIPLMFTSFNEKSLLINDQSNFGNSVDIMLNAEEEDFKFMIADFHGEISEQSEKLMKAFSAFSTMTFINVTIKDVGPSSISDELKNLFSWFQSLKNQIFLTVLVRDFENNDQKIEIVNQITNAYNKQLIRVLFVKNLNGNKFKKPYSNSIQEVIKSCDTKLIQSISIVKDFITKLDENPNYALNELKNPLKIMKRLTKTFKKFNENKSHLVFKLTDLNNSILNNENQIIKLLQSSTKHTREGIKSLDNRLKHLKVQRGNANPFNKYMKLFISLILNDDFEQLLSIFEKFLIKMKTKKLEYLENKRKSYESADQVQEKWHSLKTCLLGLDRQIEQTKSLTLDSFWAELFLIYDWIKEKQRNFFNVQHKSVQYMRHVDKNVEIIVDRYVQLVHNGFPIQILRGTPLKLEAKLLEMVFKRLEKHKNLLVLSVIGEQSSGKSSLLNSLFGCDFKTSVGRCTSGVYMNVLKIEDKTLVVLDTEGLMSVDSGSKTMDNQLATMAVLCSQFIIINHKGEISSNLQDLIGITYYAKMRLLNYSFKPSMMFVLRDQNNRDNTILQNQATKLKVKINQQASLMKLKFDDVIDIDTDNVILLPNAYSETQHGLTNKPCKWRNDVFPNEVLNLRKKLMDQMLQINDKRFNNLEDLYVLMGSHWQTLEELGDGIMCCKDLEELKIRNEIVAESNRLLEEFCNNIHKELSDIMNENMNKISLNFKEEIVSSTIIQLEDCHKQNLHKIFEKYDKRVDASNYPENIKIEYKNRIENNFEWIKDTFINEWKDMSMKYKIKNQYEENRKAVFEAIQKDIDNFNSVDEVTQKLNEIFEKNDQLFNTSKNLFSNDDELIRNIEERCNKTLMLMKQSNKYLEYVTSIVNLKDFIKSQRFDVENWFVKNTSYRLKKLKTTVGSILTGNNEIQFNEKMQDQIISLVKNSIIPEVKSLICKPYINDSNIRNMFHIINNHLFNTNSFILKNESFIKMSVVLKDILRTVLLTIYESVKSARFNIQQAEAEEIENHKKNIKKSILDDYSCRKNAKELGKRTASHLERTLCNFLLQKHAQECEDLIRNEMMSILKSPENLMNLAFKESFEISNYQNVYKYAKNIQKYCLDIAELHPEKSFNAILDA